MDNDDDINNIMCEETGIVLFILMSRPPFLLSA
jgi:hypothetical protein